MGHIYMKNHYLNSTSTFHKRLNFEIGVLTWTALLLTSKAKVQKILFDQLSVNVADRQANQFGPGDLVWP